MSTHDRGFGESDACGQDHPRTIDVHLSLLDRQLLDPLARMLGKVDDIELAPDAEGGWWLSGILTGPGALGPRFPGLLGDTITATWERLSGRDRREPQRVDEHLVAHLGTGVTLRATADELGLAGLESWARQRIIDALPGAGHPPDADGPHPPVSGPAADDSSPAPEGAHRFSGLLGMEVLHPDGTSAGRVVDATLRHTGPPDRHYVLDALLIGRHRPGAMFGYQRHPDQGPWFLRHAIQFLHRDNREVAWRDVADIEWEEHRVRLRPAADLRRPW